MSFRTPAAALGRVAAALALALAGLLVLLPTTAGAHSLESSTIAVVVSDDSAELTISLAVATLDEALGTSYLDAQDLDEYPADLISYLDEHLTVTGADGSVWGETYLGAERETVEGIESFIVQVALDNGDSSTSRFTLTYDAVIETVDGHQAVVVLTDSNDDISTVGTIEAGSTSLEIVDGARSVPVADMVGYGFHHVLEGADHLLFLLTLLLPAPLVAAAGRWRPAAGVRPTATKVVHVITAFTVGHSVTLMASALGWVTVPSRPVEVLIAVSVGISALHALRPLARRGEELIAVLFGLVHGLAFAGILADLGLDGSTSVLTLLAFNVGIELSQLLVTVLLFPSLWLLARTSWYPTVRLVGAGLALAAATGWALDRLGLVANPLAGVEDAAISHPWMVVAAVAVLAATAQLATAGPRTTAGRFTPSP